jgi:predicted unusual protein kinase regulating ubiquinone biosynthesis (AarF/ABC1/UbiB family)
MLKEGIKTYKFVREFKNLKNAEDEISRKKALVYIKEILGNEGGLLIKLLQYLGTKQTDIDEVLRSDDSDKSIGIPRTEIIEILKNKYGSKFDQLTDISEQAFPASVGQVHRAKLVTGESVAVKVQYPKIKNVFTEQLRLLKLLPAMTNATSMKKWGIDFKNYQQNLEKMIKQECDYLFEINELKTWRNYLSSNNDCHVPRVFDKFSLDDVYVQEFIEGDFLDDVVSNWLEGEKKIIAKNLTHAYFELFLNHSVAQGDTNFGNFIFSRSTEGIKINFIDLGQTVHFSKQFIFSIAQALKNELNGIEYSRVGFLRDIGFDIKKLKHIASKADLIVEILFEPFKAGYAYNVNSWKYKESLDLLLGEDKWWFRSAGGTEFFFFMKSFMGVKNIVAQLDVSVFYNKILNDLLNNFEFGDFQISEVKIDEKYLTNTHGKHLIVNVFDNNLEKVKVTLPFNALFDLGEYLDPKIIESITRQGYDIEKFIRKALEDGGKPKDIFHIIEEKKEYIVKIE